MNFLNWAISIRILLLIIYPAISLQSKSYENLAYFLKMGQVETAVFAKGGHSGNCITMTLFNRTTDSLYIRIEPGRRLISKEFETQDILIVKENLICLTPKGTINADITGFCCQSSFKSPMKNEEFEAGIIEDYPLKAISEYISTGHFDNDVIQSAIWVLSDNHKIASICTGGIPENNNLVKKVAEIKQIQIPWYCITYQKNDSLVFSNKHILIRGDIHYYVKQYCTISIVIKSEKTGVMTYIAKDLPYQQGNYTYPLEQSVINWPKGKYELLVLEDNTNLVLKKDIEL